MKLTIEQKEANKLARKQARELNNAMEKVKREAEQKEVASVSISIEWKKSRTWGANPHLDADIRYKDGSYANFKATCSGCGYDKESTVIADLFNQVFKYKLHPLEMEKDQPREEKREYPYGIYIRPHYQFPWLKMVSFSGGIGTNCYYNICKFIGLKFEQVASGKTYDAYRVTNI
jgi:hypothetical protein